MEQKQSYWEHLYRTLEKRMRPIVDENQHLRDEVTGLRRELDQMVADCSNDHGGDTPCIHAPHLPSFASITDEQYAQLEGCAKAVLGLDLGTTAERIAFAAGARCALELTKENACQ